MGKPFKVVLVANDNHPIPDWIDRKFSKANIDFTYHDCHTRDELAQYASEADVLWLTSSRKELITENNLDVCQNAGAVIKCGSGTDNIELAACTKRGILVTHTPDSSTEPTSDHAIAMLFASVRRIARQDCLIRTGAWNPHLALPLGPFTGARLGLVGFGRIGKAIVRKLAGFHMNIQIADPFVDSAEIENAGAKPADLKTVLKESQYIIIACPLTKETENLIDEKELKMMRSDAVLVNTARAGIVNEEALFTVLKENWIKVAAIDVFSHHPLEPSDKWLTLDNVTFTPHLGGHDHTYPDQVFRDCVDVIIELSKMHLPRWIVNRDVKPRWNMTS